MGKGPLPRLIIFIFSGFAWALWTSRNKMAIDKKYPKTPTDVIFIALSFQQKWSASHKEKDQERIRPVKDSITSWLKNFKPSTVILSDIVEI
jgi:DNA-directed RNA polymerase specialized sigma54-like protein